MSCLITSVNSVSPSLLAPLSARLKSWARRASDSMMRSRTTSCAIAAATCGGIDESNELTFDAMFTVGIGGSVQTRPDAETGPELTAGGRALDALSATQLA